MKVKLIGDSGFKIWASATDTQNWANRPGNAWPCSFLAGRSLFIEVDARGDLIDLSIDNGRGDQDCPANEMDAFLDFALETVGGK